MTHPDIAGTVLGEGICDSARNGRDGHKPVTLQEGNATLCADPNLPAIVLKEALRLVVWQSTVGNLTNGNPRRRRRSLGGSAARGAAASAKRASLAINRNLSFIPSIQAVSRAQPKTDIAGGENGKDPSAGETLLFGEGWDGKIAKLVQAIAGRHPNIALAILEE